MSPEEQIERRRESRQRWEERNPEKRRASLKRWVECNPEKRREAWQGWGERNPEKRREAWQGWIERNPEKRDEVCHEWQRRNPEKRQAHIIVGNALRDGKLIRPDFCTRCFTRCKPEAHHEDYAKPLDVQWLCKTCHKWADSERRALSPSSSPAN